VPAEVIATVMVLRALEGLSDRETVSALRRDIARKVAKDRVNSTVDPQARHARKPSADKRDGYKGHIAAEPEIGLVTECALTATNAADGPTGGSGCSPRNSRGSRSWGIRPTAS
jgi:hypothetical protein